MKTTNTTTNINTVKIERISHEVAHKILAESNNIVGVEFIKKDNTTRIMNCRRRVQKYLNGGKNTTAHMPNIINVFDMTKKEYRKINSDNILSLKVNKTKYIIDTEY